MNDVYIIEPIRTPVGKYGGALSSVRPDDMAAIVLKELVNRTGIPGDVIDDVILGCANQAGEDNRNIARMAVLLAGLPQSVPGVTVNRLCASSIEAVIQGARAIRAGEADVIIAGGVESMSRAPYAMPKNVSGAAAFGNLTAYDTALGWRFPNPAMEKLFPLEVMGETAENIAERWQISRDEQDEYALQSHQLAVKAQNDGIFKEAMVEVRIPQRKGDDTVVDRDEQPRADTTLEKLSSLKPAFRKGGSVTAGNSSSLNDGAGAMLLASEEAVKKYNLKPVARYVSSGTSGVDPRIMGIGPVFATNAALKRAGLKTSDIGLVELNEAFAAQALACIRDLGVDPACVNPYGGAISIGHPLGMSGSRIIATLTRAMQKNDTRYGVATACIGVGQGLAAIFEKA
ncbi:MAG TPA: thiolase family protein [Patescibacteria group bacterium]|nr:thiolase family protein [Patescibacteria group bacterium]